MNFCLSETVSEPGVFTNKFRTVKLIWLSICLGFHFGFAQNDPNISIKPAVIENQIYIFCKSSPGFLDQDMRESLLSGMSRTLNFQLILADANGKIIRSKLKAVQLRYDIWEKKYQIFSSGKIHHFSALAKFEVFLYDSLRFKLGNIRSLARQKKLQVVLLFSPQKITNIQQKKLNYWLTSTGETAESKPALEPESGFSIDLSRLFSIFMSKKPSVKTLEFRSALFTIQGLMNNEVSAQ